MYETSLTHSNVKKSKMDKSKLQINNRWKLDNNEKNEWKKKRTKKPIKKEPKNEVKKENLFINNEIHFPSLVENINVEKKDISKEYLERVNNIKDHTKDLDDNIKFRDGWIAYKKDKKTNKILISRNGRNYYNTLRETYTEEEYAELEKQDFQNSLKPFLTRINELYKIRKKESDEYYNETGKLDEFAVIEKEAQEYEEYLKKFEENEQEQLEEIYSDDDSDYNNDIEEEYF